MERRERGTGESRLGYLYRVDVQQHVVKGVTHFDRNLQKNSKSNSDNNNCNNDVTW